MSFVAVARTSAYATQGDGKDLLLRAIGQ